MAPDFNRCVQLQHLQTPESASTVQERRIGPDCSRHDTQEVTGSNERRSAQPPLALLRLTDDSLGHT